MMHPISWQNAFVQNRRHISPSGRIEGAKREHFDFDTCRDQAPHVTREERAYAARKMIGEDCESHRVPIPQRKGTE